MGERPGDKSSPYFCSTFNILKYDLEIIMPQPHSTGQTTINAVALLYFLWEQELGSVESILTKL